MLETEAAVGSNGHPINDPPFAPPGGLWLFGEEGVELIFLTSEARLEIASRLFPEAEVMLETDGYLEVYKP